MVPISGSTSSYARADSIPTDASQTLSPVWPIENGWVKCSLNALMLIDAYLRHQLQRVQRRPDENEWPHVISNGATFVFDQSSSGIVRWTDGKNWNPSRVRGNFILYRELEST